jgi:hypothetical protein
LRRSRSDRYDSEVNELWAGFLDRNLTEVEEDSTVCQVCKEIKLNFLEPLEVLLLGTRAE